MQNYTPLRYPGGKARLRPYVEALIAQNGLQDAHYVEPYCGGAGLALELLQRYVVDTVHINDLDRAIFSFWSAAVHNTDALCAKIEMTPCNIETWRAQHDIWLSRETADPLELAFATFFLNRTNRSGILAAGPIGGKQQLGEWKIDARYRRDDLIKRLEAIGRFRTRIKVYNDEALVFLSQLQPQLPDESLVYLDPPYVEKGPGLYLSHYGEEDHRAVAAWVSTSLARPWIVSYDAHPLIAECYGGHACVELNFAYSAYGNARRGAEVMFFSHGLNPPVMSDKRSRYRKPWISDQSQLAAGACFESTP